MEAVNCVSVRVGDSIELPVLNQLASAEIDAFMAN